MSHTHISHIPLQGIGQANTSYPCPYCEVKITIQTSLKKQLAAAKPRSCQSNRRHFKQMKKNTKLKPSANSLKHKWCISDPCEVFPQSTDVISWCRLPEVHLHLHLNWYIAKIEKAHPIISEWYLKFHQTRSDYHGGDFQGWFELF